MTQNAARQSAVSSAYSADSKDAIGKLRATFVHAFLNKPGYEGTFYFDPTNHWNGRVSFVDYSGTTVTSDESSGGQTVTKTGGTNNAYDAAAYINYVFTGNYEIWIKPSQTQNIRLGVDASPIASAGYTDLDFASSFGNSNLAFSKNGVSDGTQAVSNLTNWFCFTRISNVIYVYENSTRSLTGATLRKTFTGTMTGTHYVKASVYDQNKSFTVLAIDTANEGTGYVQADATQAVYIAPVSVPTGQSGAWVRTLENNRIKPEWFGAVGDGTTNDTTAFNAVGTLLNAWGHGTLSLRPDATYVVGVQTLGGDPDNFSYAPDDIIYLSGFSGHIKIEGNGATIKAADGLRIGSFDPATGDVYNPGGGAFSDRTYMASPYEGMFHAESYTGSLEIENITLDGNESNLVQGGYWGDTGFQVPCSGLQILPGTGKLFCRNVRSINHGTDGGTYQATVDNRMDASVIAHFLGCEFSYAGRNGFSLTGGRGVVFENCKFNHTSRGTIETNPQYGFDMEPDGGKYARDITFINCEFLNNNNGGYGGGSGRMSEINFYDCRFSGDPQASGATSIAVYVTKPGHKFHNCKIAGFYQVTATSATKYEFKEQITEEGWGPQFFHCIFTNNPNEYYGGIGPTFSGGGPSVSDPVLFENCTWDYNVTAWAATTEYLVDATVRNGSNFYRCTTAGTSAGAGGPTGTGSGITDGTAVWIYAGDTVSAASSNTGSEPYRVIYRNCSFFDYSSGVSNLSGNFEGFTKMNFSSGSPAVNASPQYIFGRYVYNGVEQFVGSKTFDWASIAAAGVATTTVTVPLAKVGDNRTYTASMSNGWGGLIAFCEVTAANTVTVTAFNPTAGAIDLASGTLSVVGVR